MRLEAINNFATLPNFAQALMAIRMVQRALPAKITDSDPDSEAERALFDTALTAATRCCRDGHGNFQHESLFKRAMELRDLLDSHRAQREWLRAALWFAIDAVNAAEMANDFPVDTTVTRSAQSAIAALGEDNHLSRMQITILLASDIDQLLFACSEVDKLPSRRLAAKYEGLGDHILLRLAPANPLTLIHFVPTGEAAAR